jgi:hypothetical protein
MLAFKAVFDLVTLVGVYWVSLICLVPVDAMVSHGLALVYITAATKILRPVPVGVVASPALEVMESKKVIFPLWDLFLKSYQEILRKARLSLEFPCLSQNIQVQLILFQSFDQSLCLLLHRNKNSHQE